MEPQTTLRPHYRITDYVPRESQQQPRDRYGLHLLLFFLTLACTVYSGGLLAGRLIEDEAPLFILLGLPLTPTILLDGLRFGGALLFFLTVHEFGHYFAARYHRISTSLPYYIPLPFIGIGTFGAVIRIREAIPSKRKLFDIGAAGPLAGFVVALGLLVYALATLPDPTYLLDMPGHEAMKAYILENGTFPSQLLDEARTGETLVVGYTPLYWLLSQLFADVPPMYEMYHYPVLFAAWLGLFFTAFNLLPVGQLDGGHILYALFGKIWHKRLAYGFFLLLMLSGAIGFMTDPMMAGLRERLGAWSWVVLSAVLYVFLSRVMDRDLRLIAPTLISIMLFVGLGLGVGESVAQYGYFGWLVFCLLIVYFVRVEHPPVLYEEPLTSGRRALAYLSIIIFFLCFSIKPLYVI